MGLELGSLKILTNLFFQHMVQYYQYQYYQYQYQYQQRQQEEGEEIKQSNHNNHHHHRYYNNEDNIKFCSKIIQAMSANVRSYELAETLFLNLNEQSKQFIELGLGMKVINTTTTTNKKKKTRYDILSVIDKETYVVFFIVVIIFGRLYVGIYR